MIVAGPANRARLAAVERLRAGGVASPQYDAAELLAHLLGIDRGLLPMASDLDDEQARRYAEMIERRAGREPLQHIVGSAGFYGLDFQVGPGVFIPRPETEVLVSHALAAIEHIAEPTVIDLCSGSGAIAVAIATQRPTAQVLAIERSGDALRWLRKNSELAAGRVHVLQADVLAPPPAELQMVGGVDLVTCNPPYVPLSTAVDPEVADHDPQIAVFGGEDGLELIRPLVARIAELLRPGAITVLEHDESHQDQVVELFRADGRFGEIDRLRDLTERPRFVRAHRLP